MTVVSNSVDPSKIVATGGPSTDNNAIGARFRVTAGTDVDERIGVGVRTVNAVPPLGYNYVFHNFASSTLNETKFLNDAVLYSPTNYGTGALNTFYIFECFTNGTNLYGRTNYGTLNSVTLASMGTARSANPYSINIGSKATTTNWDWVFIRKCIPAEPAHGTWGAQQIVPPAITSFTPGNGCANTTSVTITGTNFTGATVVKFGVTNALSFTVNSATTITAIPAGGTTGVLSVTTAGGTVTSSGTFTVNPVPVSSVTNQSDISCFNGSNGSITINATPAANYIYSVNNGGSWTSTPTAPPVTISGLSAAGNPFRIRVQNPATGCISK